MGNWVNKEWSQIDAFSGDEKNEKSNETKQKTKMMKRKTSRSSDTSLNSSHESNERIFDNQPLTPVANNKIIVADFDPRSPTNGIVRTPICYVSGEKIEEKKSQINPIKFSIDPRSPTNQYNRTPIQLNPHNDSNFLNNSNLNESISSICESSSDSSLLLQQVPGEAVGQSVANPNSISNDSPTKQLINGAKLVSSNLPRHILQRKQVEKLNKKKLIDSQDKENNF